MSLVAHSEDPSTKITCSVAITKITEVDQCNRSTVVNHEVAAMHVAVKKDPGALHFSTGRPIENVLRNLCGPFG